MDVKPASIPKDHIAVRFIQCGLEAFEPEAGRYDIIWVQWALMYLTDGMNYLVYVYCMTIERSKEDRPCSVLCSLKIKLLSLKESTLTLILFASSFR